MAQLKINEATYRRIYERQWEYRWDAQYDAAIHATAKEAPSVSVATILSPAKLGNRPFHTLSRGETWAALLALYNPATWDVHEQRILYPTSRPNFLAGHPRALGQRFAPFAGTVDVADRLGMLSKHPKFSIQIEEDGDPIIERMPFFYIGDLLLFLEDDVGAFAVNWTIKNTESAFRRQFDSSGRTWTTGDDEKVLNRHRLEEVYYADAGVRTQQITADKIDFDFRCNLYDLFLAHSVSVLLDDASREKAMELFRSAVGAGVPGNQLCREVASSFGVTGQEAVVLLKQAVWHRRVRVDLFRPFLVDKPLYPEREDALTRYAHWFAR